MTDTMNRSWLVQRLERPRGGNGVFGAGNPFAFGGGLRNGGLTDEAMGLLRDIFSFDYMGAAEFEFGAVPKALNGLAKDHKRLTAGSFAVARNDAARSWREKKGATYDGEMQFFYIARKQHVVDVEARVRDWAALGYQERLKESTHLSEILRPASEGYTPETAGWLELDNGFFVFADRVMFERTADLFGVKVEAATR